MSLKSMYRPQVQNPYSGDRAPTNMAHFGGVPSKIRCLVTGAGQAFLFLVAPRSQTQSCFSYLQLAPTWCSVEVVNFALGPWSIAADGWRNPGAKHSPTRPQRLWLAGGPGPRTTFSDGLLPTPSQGPRLLKSANIPLP